MAAPRTDDATPSRRASRAAAWLPALSAVALAAAIAAAVLVAGRAEAARGARVLSALDPLFFALKARALPLLEGIWTHRSALGVGVAAASALLATLALVKGRRQGLPVALAAAAAALATWGELLLLSDRLAGGWALYAAALVTAAIAGALAPLATVPRVPTLPLLDAPRTHEERMSGPPGWGEAAVLFTLLLLALGSRAWAINQLPVIFDDEMISVQTQSRTVFGLGEFLKTEFVGTSNGLVTPLTNRAVYALLGVSITSMRITALLWGLVAVGLFWTLARRILGGLWGPAGVTLLFIGAPEQLFWSRSEVSIFAPMAVIGLLFAHAGLSLTRRFSARAVLIAALLTPFCRFFYTAAHVLVVYPVLLAGHALGFVRGAARRALLSLPVLGAGIALWIFSVSAAIGVVAGTWSFVHPARVRGEEAWRAGLPADTPPAAVARAQAARLLSNLSSVAAGLTYHEAHATHWYERFHLSPRHNTTIGVGLAVLAALGLGWLLGQPAERRAVLLLFWLGLGLLPGCLSDEPEARRNAVMFTPLLLIAGVFVVAVARLARARGGRAAGGLAAALGGAALLGVAGTGLASHLLLPVKPIQRDEEIRFAAPLFARSHIVLHNLFYRKGKTVAFGQLDRLLSPSGPCYQYVEPDGLLKAALAPECDFREEVFHLTLSPAEIAARRAAARPRLTGYLLADVPSGRRLLALLRVLHPSASVAERRFELGEESLYALQTDSADLAEALRPETGPGFVRGGFVVPRDGWWEASIEPPCPGASARLGAVLWNGSGARPLLAGVHPFHLERPAPCGSAFRLFLRDARGGGRLEPILVGRCVAELAEFRAPEAVPFPGYGEAIRLLRLPSLPSDFAVDRAGRICTLGMRDLAWELVLRDAEGREIRRARPDLPWDLSTAALAVAPDGDLVVFSLNVVEVFDASLRSLTRWPLPEGVVGSDVAFLPDGRIAFVTNRNGVEVFSREGRLEASFFSWTGGEGRFTRPVGLAVGPAGLLAVAESTGSIQLFRLSPSGFSPEFVRTLSPEVGAVPFTDDLRGIAFDGTDRLLLPYSPERPPLLLDLEGRRFMATTAEADLSSKGLVSPYRFARTPEELYVVDRQEAMLWRVARRGTR